MTIIKANTDSKGGKQLKPLVDYEQQQHATAPPTDMEAQTPDPAYIILRARARRVSTTTTLCLVLTAFLVVGTGIIGGTYLYRQYLRSQIFKGWCSIPYNDPSAQIGDDLSTNYSKLKRDMFNEQLELDIQNDIYEKIDVPDFINGRRGRFVHDFNTNKTGIIDVTGGRCFVMPLNKDNVLPPKSLYDLMQKMWNGYYKVDTEIIRETMRVVTPPLSDMSDIGEYIAAECEGLPVYKLEKLQKGVWKRSAEEEIKFSHFSGVGILEFDIVNLNEIENYEKENH